VLRQGVQGISDIITIPGIINRDFADVKTTMAGMGHAVMGMAIGSGTNRAVEAAQAAMGSPLLEAGAIDGARGILINITGSSSLKLSEVNQASSLIQSAAHEDANIIFGAVLDEKMGDQVKITVIATGFRDQMPERRARMLNVEEAPVISVPVVAPDNWFEEPAAVAPPAAAPTPARFLGEEEEEETAESDAAFFFSSATPVVATTVNVAAAPANPDQERPTVIEPEPEPDPEEPLAGPRFAEMREEPAINPQARDYAAEFGNAAREPIEADENPAQPASTLFTEPGIEEQRDLDIPAIMRRLRF
jgi:cell division protein FtsZ